MPPRPLEKTGSAEARELRRLRDKYERILVLRRAHERARADPSYREPDPRPAMALLAEEFPGSLREIDVLPLALVEARIEALGRAERQPSTTERWMQAQARFHRLARAVLATKRWLAGRRDITPLTSVLAHDLPVGIDAADAKWLALELARIATPPRGRLMDLVYAKLAEELGCSTTEAQRLVR